MKFLISLILSLFLFAFGSAEAAVYNFSSANGNATDTLIRANQPTTNWTGSQTYYLDPQAYAYLMRFDLTSISGQRVTSAKIWIWTNRGNNHTMSAERLTKDIVSTQATWNIASTGNSWGTAGALGANDYTTVNAIHGIGLNEGGYQTIDVTALMNDALAAGNFFDIAFRYDPAYDTGGDGGGGYGGVANSTSPTYLVAATGTPGAITTWYVRPDGGTCGLNNQCTGTTNAAYPGAGVNQNCACNHPNWLTGTGDGAQGIMNGGDILRIATATYHIENGVGNCSTNCEMNQIPSGSNEQQVTQVYGGNYDPSNRNSCTAPALLVGHNGGHGLTVGSYTAVHCVDLRSASGCKGNEGPNLRGKIDNEPTQDNITCRDGNANEYMWEGLKLVTLSTGVTIDHMNIYGAAEVGVEGYQLGHIMTHYLHVFGAGSTTWSGDPGSGYNGEQCGSSNPDPLCQYTGPFEMDHLWLKWSGCGWREKATPGGAGVDTPHDCIGQAQGNYPYGDCFGMNGMSGDWTINDCQIENCMQDGLDMLYDHSGNKKIDRCLFEGSVGAAFKSSSHNTTISNSIVLSDCEHWNWDPALGAFPNAPGRAGTSCNNDGFCDANENAISCPHDCVGDNDGFQACRAGAGIALSGGDPGNPSNMTVENSTMSSNQSINITLAGSDCSQDSYVFKNNIFIGAEAYWWFNDFGRTSDWIYHSSSANGDDECPGWKDSNVHQDYNIIYNAQNGSESFAGAHDKTIDPQVVGPLYLSSGIGYMPSEASPATGTQTYYTNFYLKSSSPARNAADPTIEPLGIKTDAYNYPKTSTPDIGGVQYGGTGPIQNLLSAGATCAYDGDCASDICVNSICASGPISNGGACSTNWDCANNSCLAGICQICSSNGASCTTSATCCGGLCSNNVCASCTPYTCNGQGWNCGTPSDGCSGTLSCGSCTSPQTCGGGGTANVCGVANCGTCNATYQCGSTVGTCSTSGAACTATAGTCTSPQTCGGGGIQNVCGVVGCGTCNATYQCGSTAGTCSGNGASCTATAGTCTLPQTCGGGGTPNVCGGGVLDVHTWYVRDGGGTPTQCTGHANSVYQGSGTGLSCAINHPSWILGSPGGTQLIAASDTLNIVGDSDISWNFIVSGVSSLPAVGDVYTVGSVPYTITLSLPTGFTSGTIAASGASIPPASGTLIRAAGNGSASISYSAIGTAQAKFMIGYGMPNQGSSAYCSVSWAYACGMNGVPAGTDSSHPTKVIGIGSQRPQLWGTQGMGQVLSFTNGNVDIENLEITSHSPCSYQGADPNGVVDGISAACPYTGGTFPFGLFAKSGIAIGGDNVTTKNLFVHRVASQNIWFSAPMSNWNSTNDIFTGSGQGGALTNTNNNNESFSGTNSMTNDIWAFGGCSEHYPDPYPNNPLDYRNYHHCCDQACGGYSLGGGFMQQSDSAPCGNWNITGSKFLYNIKTNIDLLHCSSIGTFNFYRSISEGSTGEALKIGNPTTVNLEESQLIGNAISWMSSPLSTIVSPKAIDNSTVGAAGLAICRGGAVTIFGGLKNGTVNYINSDVSGNCVALIETKSGDNLCPNDHINAVNTKFIGGDMWTNDNSAPTGQRDQGIPISLYYVGGTTGNNDGPCGTPSAIPLTLTNSSCYNVGTYAGVGCNSGTNTVTYDPMLTGESSLGAISNWLGPNSYYSGTSLSSLLYLQPTSPLRHSATTSAVFTNGSSNDINGTAANTPPDIGAVQFGSCAPTNCSVNGWNCGTPSDGCSGTLNCGSCTSPQTCGGGGTSYVCGVGVNTGGFFSLI